MCVHTNVCGFVNMRTDAHQGLKKTSVTLELAGVTGLCESHDVDAKI